MKETKQSKEYNTPQFLFVKTGEQNKVFFAASGTPGPAPRSASATLNAITGW